MRDADATEVQRRKPATGTSHLGLGGGTVRELLIHIMRGEASIRPAGRRRLLQRADAGVADHKFTI
jgi:hypothetical protein